MLDAFSVSESGSRGGGRKGCLIAAIVAGVLLLGCGGVFALLGWAVWTNPDVQRGVAIAGAAMDMTREALTAPGTAEMRRAGCTQAMALTPELMRRFLESVVDAGVDEQVPEVPMIFCAMQQGATSVPSCEEVVRAYASGVSPAPAEVAVRVGVQREREPRCDGIYSVDGAYVRPVDDGMRRTFGQVGRGATGAP